MNSITNMLGRKLFSVAIVCFCILTVYFKLVAYKILFNENLLLFYTGNLFFSILILYIIYILINIIEYIVLKSMKIIEIRQFVIYPFVIDEVVRFNPIKLLYNQECVRDVFLQNVLFCYSNNQSVSTIKTIFKKMKWIKEVVVLVSLMIFAVTIKLFLGWNVIIQVILLYMLLTLFSFCYFGMIWKGNSRVILEDNFEEYILSIRYCKEIVSSSYSDYLYELIEANKLQDIDNLALLKILENYLYSCIYERQTLLSIKNIQNIILKLENNEEQVETLFFIKLLQTKKLIGLLGKELKDNIYLACGMELITEQIITLSEENSYNINDKAIRRLQEYNSFLSNELLTIDCKEHFVLDMNNLFNSEIEVENIIKKITSNKNNCD